jgi:hypothetical protein
MPDSEFWTAGNGIQVSELGTGSTDCTVRPDVMIRPA